MEIFQNIFQKYIDNGSINYLGTAKDVRPYIEEALMLMLPSHREGIPMTIMEAESIGRGIIASNSVGCKDTVKEGYNGFLVDQPDVEAMANRCMQVLENKKQAVELGKNARKFAEDNFDQKVINQQIFEVINMR